MNEKIEMKKKLLKQALSKNQQKKQEATSQRIVGKILQSKKIQQKPIQSVKKLSVRYKKQTQESDTKQKLIRIEEEISSVNHDNSIYTQSDNFSQKPSFRSSFSDSLYTEETDNVKILISRAFEKKGFIEQVRSALADENVKLRAKEQIMEMKPRLLSNQVLVLSLEARIRQKKGRQRQDLVEREVSKKIVRQILLNQNQKECYNAELRIQNLLQEKLKRIKRKEY